MSYTPMEELMDHKAILDAFWEEHSKLTEFHGEELFKKFKKAEKTEVKE